ncbi:hypothetical protein [Subtercola boreus]|uniref:hypothetical protein n=1 Tax=Subtercola boreus TaxID=120213 RepID=UPI0015587C78|nr:hypothetical protein [Subtercola boreus]
MKHPTPNDVSETDHIETAEDILEENIVNASLAEQGLLPVPDAAPSDGPAPAA